MSKSKKTAIAFMCVFGILLAALIYKTVDLYTSTVEWKKLSDVKISDIDPKMLYLPDNEKVTVNNYTQIKSDIWDSTKQDFKNSVEDEKIAKLNEYYGYFTNKEIISHYEPDHQMINKVYSINKSYDNLFNEQGFIKESVQLKDVEQLLSNSDYIVSLLESKGEQQWANKMYQNFLKLQSDVLTMSQYMEVYNKTFKFTDNIMEPVNILLPGTLTEMSKIADNLKYKWQIIDSYKAMLDKFTEFAKENDVKNTAHSAYQQALTYKNKFESWLKDYNSKKDSFEKSIIIVPDLIDKDLQEAEDLLKDLKIEYTYKEVYNYDKKNKVVKQSIKPGTKITQDMKLSFEVGK